MKGENGLVSNPRDDRNDNKRGASRQDNTGQKGDGKGNTEEGMRAEEAQVLCAVVRRLRSLAATEATALRRAAHAHQAQREAHPRRLFLAMPSMLHTCHCTT